MWKEGHLFLIFCFFSILATLARLGVTLLSQYPGSYLSGIVWSNFTSCFLMGFVTQSVKIWEVIVRKDNVVVAEEVSSTTFTKEYRHYTNKKEANLYVGITTGFCGSFSLFSSWILELFEYSANTVPSLETGAYYHFRNPAYGLLQFLSVFITQLSMSCAGLFFGGALVRYLEREWLYIERHCRFAPKNLQWFAMLETCLEALGAVFVIVSLVLAIVERTWRSWTLAMLFSPFACYLRYFLAKIGNRTRPDKKWWNLFSLDYLGTYAANLIAVTVLAIVTLVSRGKASRGHPLIRNLLHCQVLTAFANGFCGVLSTVSTFVNEVVSLGLSHSVYYVFVSILSTFCVMLLIVGLYNWTIGLEERASC